ncbi:hypothetical protein AB0I55_14615 [Actinocatenispora sera]|uniref:hypothetical protein n=1 Tax=Actinocatenispora sera TaxID=390989 RepID=UPI0033C44A22
MDDDAQPCELPVEATSPDGQIIGRMRNRETITVAFQPYTYHHYTDAELARQLRQLARLLSVTFRREFDSYLEETLGGPRTTTDSADSAEYQRRLAAITAVGQPPDGFVRLRSTALLDWEVEVATGTVARLPETAFLDNVHAAVQDLMRCHRMQVLALQDELFGLGLPFKLNTVQKVRR